MEPNGQGREAPPEIPPAPMLAGTFALVVLAFLPLANGGYSGLGYQIGFVLLPLTGAIAWATSNPRPRIAGWVVLICLLSGLLAFGWIQQGKTLWFNIMHIPIAWVTVLVLLRQAPKRAVLLIPVITTSAVATALYGWSLWILNGSVHYQIVSTFGLHNAYAGYLLLAWPVAAYGAFRAAKPLHGWLYWIATLYLLATLVLTYSRASWVVLGLQLVFIAVGLLWFRAKGAAIPRVVQALGAAALVMMAGLLMLAPVRSALMSITNFQGYSMQGRFRFWNAALEIFRENPLIGIGPGNFAYVYPQFQTDFVYFSVDPHSWPIQLLCELGLVGLLILGAVLTGVVCWKRKVIAQGTTNPAVIFLVVAVGGSLLHAAFDFDYTFGATTSLMGALLAYGTFLANPGVGESLPGKISTTLRLRDSAVVLLLVLLALAGEAFTLERYNLDYLRDYPTMSGTLRLKLLTQAIRFNQYNHSTHYQLGSILLASKSDDNPAQGFSLSPDAERKKQALDEIELALKLNPSFPRALALKGLLTRPTSEGEKLLEQALFLDQYNYPEHYYYYASLADDDEEKRKRLLAGMEAIPIHSPITPEHVRPTWYELNPLLSQWWYELSRLTDDPEEKDLYRKRAVSFKVYWDGQTGDLENVGDTQSL